MWLLRRKLKKAFVQLFCHPNFMKIQILEGRDSLKGMFGVTYMMASPILAFPDITLTQKRLLVVLFLGGMDSLISRSPIGDKSLSNIRKDIVVDGPSDLNVFFSINANLRFLDVNPIRGGLLL